MDMAELHSSDVPAIPRKAYSYLRFSTPEQRKGDSFRRQISLAQAYAAQHGLDLDHELTFHDVGVSAYRGQNAEAGRLAYFMEAVQSGQVPQGSLLLVEQLDRLSRLTPRKALRVLEDIVETGVTVVTLNDGREYTAQSLDNLDLIMSVLTFMRANEESLSKERRLRASWEAKRANAASRPLTGKVPAWLRLSDDRSRVEVIEERAELVRRMFDMALKGIGQHAIASTFSREGIATWGRGRFWQRSYIAKTLSNPAVIGTYQPHVLEHDGARKLRRPLEPLEGYFPAVVHQETYHAVQALRQALGAPQRGRHAHAPVSNVLAGLAACPRCGSTMTRVTKGARSRPAFVCTRAKSGAGCAYKGVRCDVIEAALYLSLPGALRGLEGAAGREAGLDAEAAAAQERVDALENALEDLDYNLAQAQSPAAMRRLERLVDQLSANLEEARADLKRLQERQRFATGLTVQARVAKALEALQPAEGGRSTAAVNLALRSLFKRAVLDWPNTEIALDWTHGGTLVLPYRPDQPMGTFEPINETQGWTLDQLEQDNEE